MGQIKNIKLHIVTDIKWANKMREDMSKVYVGGLQNNVTDPDLYDAFEKYGAVESVTIIKDRESGDSRGFGFVQFDSENSADKAISAAASDKGIKVKGELCTVEFPRPKPADGFRGGFRGRGYDRDRGGRGVIVHHLPVALHLAAHHLEALQGNVPHMVVVVMTETAMR